MTGGSTSILAEALVVPARLLGEVAKDPVSGRHLQGTPVDWILFWLVLSGLATLDCFCLAPRSKAGEALPAKTALTHCVFWFFVGLAFNVLVWSTKGADAGIVWFNGYILEYLLSMDNVFFFHVVFTAYVTPPNQLYKALFFGILGAVVLRLIFYFVGYAFFKMAWVMQVLFGIMLLWSAYQTVVSEDEEDDPKENRCVKLITKCLPLTETYEEHGAFFTRAAARSVDSAVQVEHQPPDREGQAPRAVVVGAAANSAADPEAGSSGLAMQNARWRGTLLLLVVLVLQIVDLIFAVDSVTAKLAESDSVYLDFTSSAFAMLCLRPMYFIMTHLLKYFRYLKYGVGLILAFIGVKLMLNPWIEVPSLLSMTIILLSFIASMVASWLIPEKAYAEMEDGGTKAEEEGEGTMAGGARATGAQGSISNRSSPTRLEDVDLQAS